MEVFYSVAEEGFVDAELLFGWADEEVYHLEAEGAGVVRRCVGGAELTYATKPFGCEMLFFPILVI